MLNHDRQILKYVADRGITRLVHFTRAKYFRQIVQDREILSRWRLLAKKPFGQAHNDLRRFDRHQDYICLSIQYPNVYVLNRYMETYPAAKWVILFLHTDLLGRPTTKFSPVNAATEGGRYIQKGIEGFRSLFDQCVPGERAIRRAPSHQANCPTDVQAEVLVEGRVPVSCISGIVVASTAARSEIGPLSRSLPSPVPLITDPNLFNSAEVCRRIRHGSGGLVGW